MGLHSGNILSSNINVPWTPRRLARTDYWIPLRVFNSVGLGWTEITGNLDQLPDDMKASDPRTIF